MELSAWELKKAHIQFIAIHVPIITLNAFKIPFKCSNRVPLSPLKKPRVLSKITLRKIPKSFVGNDKAFSFQSTCLFIY